MFELISFRFASDGAFTDSTTATVSATTVSFSAFSLPRTHVAACITAVDELLGQAPDGVTDTAKVLDGTTIVIQCAADLSTVTFGPVPAMPAAKAQAFVAALVAYGL